MAGRDSNDCLTFPQKYAFNKYVSDMINVKREMPDTRHGDCRKIDYDSPESLPKTSVILIFCNEALSVLLRYLDWPLSCLLLSHFFANFLTYQACFALTCKTMPTFMEQYLVLHLFEFEEPV